MPKDKPQKTNNEPRPELDVKGRTGYAALNIEQGRTLRCVDYGADLGVKIDINHATEQTEPVPILLTAKQTAELAEWLSRSQGQVITRMPIKLLEICRRVAWQKGNKVKLKRGDKAALREVVRILTSWESEETE